VEKDVVVNDGAPTSEADVVSFVQAGGWFQNSSGSRPTPSKQDAPKADEAQTEEENLTQFRLNG
jgi:hypothetical protein